MYIKEPFVALNETSGSFGVDKIHLFTDGYQINDLLEWNLKPNTKKAGQFYVEPTPLCVVNGEQIYGERLYINKPTYSAELKYGKMYVNFNPSKIYHPYKLVTSQEQIADAIQGIQNDLQTKCKIDIDLFASNIQRMDIAAQANMNNPVPFYDNVIRGAKGVKRAPKTEYPNGFLMGNRQRQMCSYDKGLKLDSDSGIKSPMASDLLRVENRLLKANAMKQHTPFKFVADILTDDSSKKMMWSYTKTLDALLPIYQSQMQFLELSTLTDLLRQVKTNYDRNKWLFMFMLSISNPELLPNAEQFEQALIPLINDGTIDRTTAWRNVKDYQKYLHETKIMKAKTQKLVEQDYEQVHAEFIDKFINPYKVAI